MCSSLHAALFSEAVMKRRWVIAVLGLAILALAYCGWHVATSQSPLASGPGPGLTLEAPDRYALEPGVDAIIWGFKGQGVRELTAHLLAAQDGRQLPGSKTVCSWNGGLDSQPIEGKLTFLLQDGDPFGAKSTRLPSLGIHFRRGGPTLTFTTGVEPAERLVEGNFPSRSSSLVSQLAEVRPGRALVAYALVLKPAAGGEESFDDVQALVRTSSGGRVVIAVLIEWLPGARQ
jgi:hypothetical protein